MPVAITHMRQLLHQFEPFAGLTFESSSGSRVEACGPRDVQDQLNIISDYLSYQFVIGGEDLQPLLRVKTVNKDRPPQIVAGIRQLDAGQIVYFPCVNSSHTWDALISHVQQISRIAHRGDPAELPEWVNRFLSKSEQTAITQIEKLDAELAKIGSQIATQQRVIDENKRLKQLIAGSGQSFAEVAATALEELGLRVAEGQHPRADLVERRLQDCSC